jgi:hypothetical protein
VDRYGHFEEEQGPRQDFDRNVIDYYQRVVRRYLEILMATGDP